MIFLLLV